MPVLTNSEQDLVVELEKKEQERQRAELEARPAQGAETNDGSDERRHEDVGAETMEDAEQEEGQGMVEERMDVNDEEWEDDSGGVDEDLDEEEHLPPVKRRGRPKKKLEEVTRNHELKLIKPALDLLQSQADQLGTTPTKLCGRLLMVKT